MFGLRIAFRIALLTLSALASASFTLAVGAASVFVFILLFADPALSLIFSPATQVLLLLTFIGSHFVLLLAFSDLLLVGTHLAALLARLILTLAIGGFLISSVLLLHVFAWNAAIIMTFSIWHNIEF